MERSFLVTVYPLLAHQPLTDSGPDPHRDVNKYLLGGGKRQVFLTVLYQQKLLNQQKLPLVVAFISTRMLSPSRKDMNIFTQKNKMECIHTVDCYAALKKQKSELLRPACLDHKAIRGNDHSKMRSILTSPCHF